VSEINDGSHPKRKVTKRIIFGIVFIPYIFSWFLLKKGYSRKARLFGFVWLALCVLSLAIGLSAPPVAASDGRQTQAAITAPARQGASPEKSGPAAPASSPMVTNTSPVHAPANVGAEFVPLATMINQIAQGGDCLGGKAERISANELLLNNRFTATVIPTVSGATQVTFYAKPGTTKIEFVKTIDQIEGEQALQSFVRTTSAIVGAAGGTNQRELKPTLDMLQKALASGQARVKVGRCELMCISQNNSAFFVIHIP
jgi:hypothetical protein